MDPPGHPQGENLPAAQGPGVDAELGSPAHGLDRRLAGHALMVGLTPLIPVPFVDDLARGYLLRRMVQALGQARGVVLDPPSLDELTREDGGGCALGGCAGGCLTWPFRRLLRKVFLFLEWKRATDLVARTWLYGSMLDGLLAQGWRPQGTGPSATRVRQAAETAMAEVGTSPVLHASSLALGQARGSLEAGAALMQSALAAWRRPTGAQVAQAVEAVEKEEEERLRPATDRLLASLSGLPEAWRQRLRARFLEELQRPVAESEEGGAAADG